MYIYIYIYIYIITIITRSFLGLEKRLNFHQLGRGSTRVNCSLRVYGNHHNLPRGEGDVSPSNLSHEQKHRDVATRDCGSLTFFAN